MKKLFFALLLCIFPARAQVLSTTIAVDEDLELIGRSTNFFNANAQFMPAALANVTWLPSMAALRALTVTGLTNGAVVGFSSYYGDGNGGASLYMLTNTVTGTNAFGGRVLALGGAKSWQLVETEPNIKQFGAIGDSSAGVAASVTAAAFYTSQNRLPLKVPPGVYLVDSTIELYRENSLIGPGGKYIESGYAGPGDPRYGAGSFAMFILATNANCKMFSFNTNGCFIRAVNTSDAGETNQLKAQAQLTIKGLQFNGTCASQTTNNADLILLRNLWNVKIIDCNIVNFRGYAIRIHDCNEFQIIGNSIHGLDEFNGKGIYMWSCADYIFDENDAGGFLGPALWVSQVTGWISPISNNKLYNNQRGRYQISGISADEITTTTDHPYETLDPVEITQNEGDTSAVFPTGTATSTVYWAIKTASNKLKLATSFTDALNGVAKTISGGSGTNYVFHGTASGLYMSQNAEGHNVTGNRFDQNQDSGVVVNQSHNNTFVGNIAAWNQYDTSLNNTDPYPAAGFYIKGVSRGNLLSGNTMQRLNNNYNQAVGIWVSSNALATVIGNNAFGELTNIINTKLATNVYYEPGITTQVTTPVMKDNREQATLGTFGNTVPPLVLRGGSGGASHLRLDRETGADVTIDIKVSDASFIVDDATDISNPRRLLDINNDGTKIVTYLGGRAFDTNIYSQTILRSIGVPTSAGLTDVRGSELVLEPGAGTGNAAPRVTRFRLPVAGSSGTTTQTYADFATFDGNGVANFGYYLGGSQAKTMSLIGGSGGASILEFIRSGVATNGISLTTGGFAFREQTGGGKNIAIIDQGNSDRDTGLRLWDRDAGTLRVVGVTNLDVGDGVTRAYLYLK